jgi:hypothetical protein
MSSRSEVHLNIQIGNQEPFDLWAKSTKEVLTAAPEAQVAVTLLPSMYNGEDLAIEEPLDPVFADNLSMVQDIYSTWWPEADRIRVKTPSGESKPTPKTARTAAFFTGGVDSFYTLLKHKEEIDALVYVHGFDVDLDDTSLRRRVTEMLHNVGTHFGKEVIEVETNLRDFSDERVCWPRYHGAALAFAGLVLQPCFDRLLIASGAPYDQLRPWGSHPLLDPNWSTSTLQFIHDGCEASRLDKCQVVGESDIARQMLRVCWQNLDSAYNCGRCEKCIRTMVQLLAANTLNQCAAFDHELDPEILFEDEGVRARIRNKDFHYHQPMQVLRETGRAPELVEAIQDALSGPSLRVRARSKVRDLYGYGRRFAGRLARRSGFRR